MVVVEKISIAWIVFWFIFYLVTHFLIGKMKQKLEDEDVNRPGNPDLAKQIHYTTLLFKWYPALYVASVILAFYAL